MKNILRAFFISILVVTIYSCNNNENSDPFQQQVDEDSKTIENYLSSNGLSGNKIGDGIYEVNISGGSGTNVGVDDILEIAFSLRKFDTDEEFYEDTSYIFIPNKGFFLEDVTGNNSGLNASVLAMSAGDISDFYIASPYAFYTSSGTLNGVFINQNQIVIANIELIDSRTEEEQKVYENEIIKNSIFQSALEADSLKSGVYRVTLEEGTGDDSVSTNSSIKADYTGSFLNGDEFDSQSNISFSLGNLIEGWQIGLENLKIGAHVIIFIPSDVAYGADGKISNDGSVSIPSFSTLVFEITIKDIS